MATSTNTEKKVLYINGDSHSAGAEAVNEHCFAGDDTRYWRWAREHDLKRWAPHPENLAVSYGKKLADRCGAELYCHAVSAGSNDRIIRTTTEYLQNNRPWAIVIGWTTWEREEWYDEESDHWYQVNASGIDSVPEKWITRYKEFVSGIDWDKKIVDAHQKIWNFKLYLDSLNIPYLFFNTFLSFSRIKTLNLPTYEWGDQYLHPYEDSETYSSRSIANGYKHNKSHHFGPDAHEFWANYLYNKLTAFK